MRHILTTLEHLTAETAAKPISQETADKMLSDLLGQLEAKEVSAETRAQVEASIRARIAGLVGKDPLQVSADSCRQALAQLSEQLEGLQKAALGIARSIDVPSHIFTLGSAYGLIEQAGAAIDKARCVFEHYLECDHCAESASKTPVASA